MPTYSYHCSKCDHSFTDMRKIDDRFEPEKEKCPSCNKKRGIKFMIGAPFIGDPVRQGITKPDGGFKEVMAKIKQNNPLGNYKDY